MYEVKIKLASTTDPREIVKFLDDNVSIAVAEHRHVKIIISDGKRNTEIIVNGFKQFGCFRQGFIIGYLAGIERVNDISKMFKNEIKDILDDNDDSQ